MALARIAAPLALAAEPHAFARAAVPLALASAAEPRALSRAAASLALALAAACQSYAPLPLDLDAHARAVEARASDAEAAGAFARGLAARGDAAPGEFDLADGVTLAEGEVLALFYNADLRLARLAAGVALARAENAGLWRDPELAVDGAQVLSPDRALEIGATLALTLPVSGRLAAEKARAGAEHEVALLRVADAEWRVRSEVRRAWARWSLLAERQRLLDGVVERIERIASVAARIEAAGALRRADLALLRVELLGRRAERAALDFEGRAARAELLGLMGLAPGAELALVPSARAAAPLRGERGLARALEANTAIAVARAEYRVAEESLRVAVREQYPDLTLGGGYGSEDGDDRALFALALPLPIGDRNRAAIAEARAERERARAVAETALERVAQAFGRADLTLASVRAERAAIEGELRPLLEEQAANLDELAALGDVDAFLLLESVGRQFEAESRLLALELAEHEALLALEELAGPSEPSEPSEPGEPYEPYEPHEPGDPGEPRERHEPREPDEPREPAPSGADTEEGR